MTDQAEARNIGHCVYADAQGDFGASFIQLHHRLYCRTHVVWLGTALLESRADEAGPQSFREEYSISRFGILILFNVLYFNHTRDRITELDLVVSDRVTSEQRHACFIELLEATAHDVSEHRKIQSFSGKSDNGESSLRSSAHGVNIAKGIRSGNLSKAKRIVHNRREEIDGLNEGRVGGD